MKFLPKILNTSGRVKIAAGQIVAVEHHFSLIFRDRIVIHLKDGRSLIFKFTNRDKAAAAMADISASIDVFGFK